MQVAQMKLPWMLVINEPKYDCYVRHLPSPWNLKTRQQWFDTIEEGIVWHSPSGMPRSTAWLVADGCSCTYGYGGGGKKPEDARFKIPAQVFPAWMENLMTEVMPLCGVHDRSLWPHACNLNFYRSGASSVDWHADSEPMFQGLHRSISIISLSLGAPRTFQLKGWWHRANVQEIQLRDGDLCTMEGRTQYFYKHRVPKGSACGSRINLTWRWVVQHQESCSGTALDGPERLGLLL